MTVRNYCDIIFSGWYRLSAYMKGAENMTFDIKISSTEQAQKLNALAQKYSFDIWVHGKSGYADAKSLLGLMLLTIETDLKLVIEDDIDTKHFEKEINEFMI